MSTINLMKAWLSAGALTLIPVILAGMANAQATQLPSITFIREVGAFDRPPPLNAPFNITGRVPDGVDRIQMESFGYLGRAPDELREAPGSETFCSAIETARRGGAHRPTESRVWHPAEATTSQTFTIYHPPLFYNREYVFIATYYANSDSETARERIAQAVRDAMMAVAGNATRTPFENGGVDNDQLKDFFSSKQPQLREAIERELGCAYFDPKTGEASSFADLISERTFETTLGAVAANFVSAENFKTAEDSANAQAGRAATALGAGDLLEAVRDGTWTSALQLAEGYRNQCTRDASQCPSYGLLNSLLQNLNLLVTPRPPDTSAELLLALGRRVAEALPRPEPGRTIYVALGRPSVETAGARYPYFFSLDGGLAWVRHFEQVVPTVAVNFKFRPRDNTDLYDTRPEFSLLAGLAYGGGDNIDGYQGFPNTSNKEALLLGIGVRNVIFPEYMRIQSGVLLYNRDARDPVVDEVRLRAAWYLSLSLNVEALKFVDTLFKTRNQLPQTF